jgi:alkaline ceramidase
MNSIINYFSSTIDWCEFNFVHSNIIAEFWNSYTSLFISICGIVGSFYYPDIKLLYYSLIPIGITSFYFHATLSLLGQLLDEFSIIISIILSLHFINLHIYKFCNYYFLCFVNILQCVLMFTYPIYNRLIFFMYAFYFWKFLRQIKSKMCHHHKYYIFVPELLFCISVFSWIIDYFICIKIINFHAIWHILIGMTGYYLFRAFYILKKFYSSIK